MRLIFVTLLALILAAVVGLGATWMTATRGTDLGTLTIGAWTALYDQKGRLVANSLQRYGFTSQEIIRGADGSFEVRVASRSRSGNWLPTGGIERYTLVLRLYDTPVGVATRTQRDAPMPAVATVGCP